MSLLAGAQPKQKMWPIVWKLLRLRALIWLNGFRRANKRRKLGMIILALLFLVFLGFVFFISWALLRFLRSPELAQYIGDMSPVLESIPVLILSGAFIGILLTSFGVLLQALYLAGDMDFLLSAPVPIRAVFITKLMQAILPNFGLICLFALPVLYGLGASAGYNGLYYPLVLAVLVALALAAAGLSSLLVMIVVRVFPARRVAEVLGFVGAIVSFLCSQSGQFAQWGEISPEQASQVVTLMERFNTPWSPLAWAGRGLSDIGQGNWLTGIGLSILTLGGAGVIFGLALTTAERLYYTGWASMQGKKQRQKEAAPRRPTGTRPALVIMAEQYIPSAVRAIVLKDFLVLRRDLRNMSQLVTPLIIGIIYAVMFLRNSSGPTPDSSNAPEWVMEIMKNIFVYANVGLSLFVGWMLLGRLAGMSFSQEGRNYWMLKSAPVSVSRLIASKFLVAYLPVLGLGWIFLLVISLIQRANPSTLLFNLLVVALCTGGNAGVNLTFGITGANFTWEDPRRMQQGGSGCLAALASMLYLPIGLVLFFGPPIGLALLGIPEALGQFIGLLLGGVFSLCCVFIPLWLVRGRVPLLAED